MSEITLEEAKKAIPADVRLIAGCEDSQTSADVSNIKTEFDPTGNAGGACTSTFLEVVYADHYHHNKKPPPAIQQMIGSVRGTLSRLNPFSNGNDDDEKGGGGDKTSAAGGDHNTLTFGNVLQQMRGKLEEEGYTQIPQLSSSRPLDLTQPFTLLPQNNPSGPKDAEEDHEKPDTDEGENEGEAAAHGDGVGVGGTRRAVMIGINYVGKKGELSGCHNDVKNMKRYIMDVWGFQEEHITTLMDDQDDGAAQQQQQHQHAKPTRANIISAFQKLVSESKSGDVAFVHFSGHGYEVPDENGDEEDGFDEAIVPQDYQTTSLIVDDEIFQKLVVPLASGVTMTVMMDCCHSGTVLDLPYIFKADGDSTEMKLDKNFDFDSLLNAASGNNGTYSFISQWFSGILSATVGVMMVCLRTLFGPLVIIGNGDTRNEKTDDKKNI